MHIFNNTHLEGLYAPTGDVVAMNTDECNYSDSEFTMNTRLFSAKRKRKKKEKKKTTHRRLKKKAEKSKQRS